MGSVVGSWSPQTARAEQAPSVKPVFQVDVVSPTRDKPQSKLWFAHGSWWVWLPTRQGSGVWRRTEDGWQRQKALDLSLQGLPGRADVWAEGNTVRAVLVDRQQLAVVTLEYFAERASYQRVGSPERFQVCDRPDEGTIETATIARDGQDRWWIAYPWRRRMWVRCTVDAEGAQWTEPMAVSDEAADDDVCAIVNLPGGVGLAWSDQKNDAVYFRQREDGADAQAWGPIEAIDSGQRTADDHLHAAVGVDGTLYLATKNSVDRVGQAQLVLRVRHPDGRWENLPYARRTAIEEPSRPIVLIGDEPARLFLLHTLYSRGVKQGHGNRIVWQSASIEARLPELDTTGRTLITPTNDINNVTGCKAMLPAQQPWVVLASDPGGRVYEGRLEPR